MSKLNFLVTLDASAAVPGQRQMGVGDVSDSGRSSWKISAHV
jgi:hypothetical protein